MTLSEGQKSGCAHMRSRWTVWDGVADAHLFKHSQSSWSATVTSILQIYWPGYVSFFFFFLNT